ncbi:MAG: 3',5'-cyclic-nucleotide phosphodiesterase [Planctomycetes bacterium]|nr:3',5'-cyclic-nucleotide phosphodiesterase [Planctomycetota bacterium]
MRVRVIGCHGGASPRHRTACFVVDDRLALDAGSIASGLTVEEQCALQGALISHTHLDHVGDLASLTDTRTQAETPTFTLGATRTTLDALNRHFWNDVLWPDFHRIRTSRGPTLEDRVLEPLRTTPFLGYDVTPIPVDHTVETMGFLVDDGRHAVAYGADTRTTETFWSVLAKARRLDLLIVEVSFPDRLAPLADLTGHLTPRALFQQLERLPRAASIDILVHGVKPLFEAEITSELQAHAHHRLRLPKLGATFTLE